jgi:uncharacterized DUF497 family protein
MFDWNEANIRHIAEHDVTPYEAEQVIANDPLDIPPLQVRNGEVRCMQLGETDAGRLLVVITTERDEKLRVVTAYDAEPRDRRYYAQQRREQYGESIRDPRFRE